MKCQEDEEKHNKRRGWLRLCCLANLSQSLFFLVVKYELQFKSSDSDRYKVLRTK